MSYLTIRLSDGIMASHVDKSNINKTVQRDLKQLKCLALTHNRTTIAEWLQKFTNKLVQAKETSKSLNTVTHENMAHFYPESIASQYMYTVKAYDCPIFLNHTDRSFG